MFQLPYEVEEFPVVNTIRVSERRVLHIVYIDSCDDVDAQLIHWISEAAELSRK